MTVYQPGGSPTNPHRTEAAVKAEQATNMRAAGKSLVEIAREVGYADKSSAHRAISRHLIAMKSTPVVTEMRELELARLDRLHAAHWTFGLAGDMKSAELILKISARRSALLGLDRNEDRIAGALEASAVAELAQASMLQAHLIAAMSEAGADPDLQDRIIAALNRRIAVAPSADDEEREPDIPGEVSGDSVDNGQFDA